MKVLALKTSDDNKRVQILMDIWNKIIDLWESGKTLTRGEVIKMLKESYKEADLVPIKGASNPPDLFDKELASLYIIGKCGMGLDTQYPEIFDNIFVREERYERAIEILLAEPSGKAREKIVALLGGKIDDNEIARMLRLKLTQVYFGFVNEDSLLDLLKALIRTFPELEKLVSKYIRFYIALKVARAIALGEIKDRVTKEALKQATALKMSWLRGIIPDDNYIAIIAKDLFKVPKKTLRNTLQLTKGKKVQEHN